jgi:transcriptional regulator with XRE-family HTH domain
MAKAFGELFKRRRTASGQTLRGFCVEHHFDPGNISKLERGIMAPPQSEEKLQQYAKALKIPIDSEEYQEFVDLGFACAGQIPAEAMADENLVPKLPVLLRTVSGKKLSAKQLDNLIEQIRRA